MSQTPPVLRRSAPLAPRQTADVPMPVLRHGSPPAQRTLPLRRAR